MGIDEFLLDQVDEDGGDARNAVPKCAEIQNAISLGMKFCLLFRPKNKKMSSFHKDSEQLDLCCVLTREHNTDYI